MKIHSDTLTQDDLYNSLFAANDRGRVADSVYFDILDPAGSRKRLRAFEVRLASSEKLPGDNRRLTNSGTRGAGNLWAATYDEWGWIIAEIFKRDPSATVGDYDGVDDFNRRTSRTFTERQG